MDNFDRKITPKSTKMQNVALTRPCLLRVWELNQEDRVFPCSASAGNMHIRLLKIFAAKHMSENNCKYCCWG